MRDGEFLVGFVQSLRVSWHYFEGFGVFLSVYVG